jgi:hypothetical protein
MESLCIWKVKIDDVISLIGYSYYIILQMNLNGRSKHYSSQGSVHMNIL